MKPKIRFIDDRTVAAGAHDFTVTLQSANDEYDAIVDSMNVTMMALAANNKTLLAPFIEELDQAETEFSAVNDLAEKSKTSAEREAKQTYEYAVSLASEQLKAALGEARIKYEDETAEARTRRDEIRRRGHAKTKELNQLFDKQKAEFVIVLRQKEFDLIRTLKRQGTPVTGLTLKRPAVFRSPR